MSDLESNTGKGLPRQFHTTHWSMVARAGGVEPAASAAALEALCRAYWYPLYAYVRRRGYDAEDGRDLTQGFFAALLAKNSMATAARERGKFRSFLLGALNHFLANEWDRHTAQKRGGGHTVFSLDEQDAGDRYLHEPVDEMSPERLYDRRWAETTLEIVFTKLRAEFAAAGHAGRFDECKPWLLGDKPDCSYGEVAARLGIGEAGVRSVVHRLRRRFRELMRAEIAHTVCEPEEVDGEIRALFQSLAG